MADLRTHCEGCLRELGEEFRFVHEWLDELFKYVGPDHRGYRHNRKGIEKVRKRWGDKAARAAEIHIRRDEEEGTLLKGQKKDEQLSKNQFLTVTKLNQKDCC